MNCAESNIGIDKMDIDQVKENIILVYFLDMDIKEN